MNGNVPNAAAIQDFLSTTLLALWAFLGSIMRGSADWRSPKTGKFSVGLCGSSIATAFVMGEIAAAVGTHWNWEPVATSALASTFGYLGAATTIQILKDRILGVKDNADQPNPPPNG